ncbi:MAG: hypothetical protein JXB14_06815 [Candidatus Altiarchaeota archaeon]|nr:hypothetical protein [Candidatus Altiarchaeota archaeon]
MGITNYRIGKIDAFVEDRKYENVEVKNTFSLKDVRKQKGQEKTLEISWEFNSNYKNLGKIFMSGTLVYFDNDIESKYEEKQLGKEKRLVLKGDALKDVSNFVLRRGIIEAIIVARTLQMPVPMQMPSVKVVKSSTEAS